MTKSSKTHSPSSPRPSDKAVVPHSSIQTETKLSGDEDLKCLLLFLRCLSHQMINRQVFEMAIREMGEEGRKQGLSFATMEKVLKAALQERYTNGLNAAFDCLGFW